MLKVGIFGCGAIGSSLAGKISNKYKNEAKISGLYDIDYLKAKALSDLLPGKKSLTVRNVDELIRKSDLVVEAASASVSFEVAKRSISLGRDVLVMSVGGIIEKLSLLSKLAQAKNCRVYIPSGAISGIDALKASVLSGVKSVVLTTYKNPVSFRGVEYIKRKSIDLNKITKDKVLFSGPAREAIKLFPQNINVAAVLSIAGIGSHNTQVKIIASPKTKNNVHKIEIVSGAGRVITETQNILHPDNPKTSYLAVLSAEAVLKQILEPVKIGT